MVHHGAGLTMASEMPAPPVDELHPWYDRPHVRVRSDRTQPRSDVDAFRIGLGFGALASACRSGWAWAISCSRTDPSPAAIGCRVSDFAGSVSCIGRIVDERFGYGQGKLCSGGATGNCRTSTSAGRAKPVPPTSLATEGR